MKDYREKDVMGFIGDTSRSLFPRPYEITVRMTSDENGQTLSLAGANIVIGIPLEEVKDIVKVVNKAESEDKE
jgi:hypothetical protein